MSCPPPDSSGRISGIVLGCLAILFAIGFFIQTMRATEAFARGSELKARLHAIEAENARKLAESNSGGKSFKVLDKTE